MQIKVVDNFSIGKQKGPHFNADLKIFNTVFIYLSSMCRTTTTNVRLEEFLSPCVLGQIEKPLTTASLRSGAQR